jgi:hypothetical protein
MVTTPPRVAYAALRWLRNGGSFGGEDEELRRGGLHVLRNLGEVPARLKRRRRCALSPLLPVLTHGSFPGHTHA